MMYSSLKYFSYYLCKYFKHFLDGFFLSDIPPSFPVYQNVIIHSYRQCIQIQVNFRLKLKIGTFASLLKYLVFLFSLEALFFPSEP